jgi:hypothetical protein
MNGMSPRVGRPSMHHKKPSVQLNESSLGIGFLELLSASSIADRCLFGRVWCLPEQSISCPVRCVVSCLWACNTL